MLKYESQTSIITGHNIKIKSCRDGWDGFNCFENYPGCPFLCFEERHVADAVAASEKALWKPLSVNFGRVWD